MTRTPQQIAADMRSMAEMLTNAADEIEQVTPADPKMLEAFKVLGQLIGGNTPPAPGGGPVEEPAPLRRTMPGPSPKQFPLIPSRGPARNP